VIGLQAKGSKQKQKGGKQMYSVEYTFTEKWGEKKKFRSDSLSRGDADELLNTLDKTSQVTNIVAYRRDPETLSETIYKKGGTKL
jgi:hypothetical protein